MDACFFPSIGLATKNRKNMSQLFQQPNTKLHWLVLNAAIWDNDTIVYLVAILSLFSYTSHSLILSIIIYRLFLVLPPSSCWGHFLPPGHFRPSSQKIWMLAQFFWVNFNIYMDSQSNILISKSLERSSYSLVIRYWLDCLLKPHQPPLTSTRKKRQNSDTFSYDNKLLTFQQPWSSIPIAKTTQLQCIKPSTTHINSFASLLSSSSLEFHRPLL